MRDGSAHRSGWQRTHLHTIIVTVEGTPADAPADWRLSDPVGKALGALVTAHSTPPGRRRVATHWARERGRISTTVLGSLAGIAARHAGKTLTDLEAEGVLEGGRAKRAGRGFFNVPVRG
jgi:ATP-dependent DNA helicase RecG